MKMHKYLESILEFTVGSALLILGGYLLTIDSKYAGAALIGIGAILFGQPFGTIFKELILHSSSKIRREYKIEQKDERNTAIREKAGAITFNIIQYLLLGITLVFIILDVEVYLIASIAGLLILNKLIYGYFLYYYNKRL